MQTRKMVKISVQDISGKRVKLLLDEEQLSGSHQMEWLGIDQSGTPLSNGIYFISIEVEGKEITKQVVLGRK